MAKTKTNAGSGFTRERLLKWLQDNPFKEAKLIMEVPIKSSTLYRIKSGNYEPSSLLANAIMNVISREETNEPKRRTDLV